MKFAIAALLAVTSAAEVPVVTNIKFNKEGLTNTAKYAKEAANDIAGQAQTNAHLNQQAAIKAYSNYRVEEYLGFQKAWSPLVKFQSELVDAYTPATPGKCNTEKLTDCLNKWQLTGMAESQKATYVSCAKYFGCESNWMVKTPAEKQAVANDFGTSIQTMEAAYEKMNQKFAANL